MFILVTVRDTVPIAPNTFGIEPSLTLLDALNKKYANKLLPKQGLAISVFDIIEAQNGKVTWGNGQLYYKVTFRLIVFAPFSSEVLVGRVMTCTPQYVRVTVDFFTDIYIPASALPPGSAFDPVEKKHFWFSESESQPHIQPIDAPKSDRLYIDNQHAIRFRVEKTEWQEKEPLAPKEKDKPPELDADGIPIQDEVVEDPIDRAGYKVIGTIDEQGLGLTAWWDSAGEEEEEQDNDAMEE